MKIFTRYEVLANDPLWDGFTKFVDQHTNGSFFQSGSCFQYLEGITGYLPFLLIATDDSDSIQGSLLGVFQSNGGGIKSWLSRRLIVWGGPLVAPGIDQKAITAELLQQLEKQASGKAIYVEFRNFFDTTSLKAAFTHQGFHYRDHLNFLVKTDTLAEVQKRVSKSRMRQIKSSLKTGATIAEATSEEEVKAFYQILQKLYREKVKKPLPAIALFIKLWQSPVAKVFVVKYEGQVVGGILCPIFNNQVIYEWYVCGEDGLIKGLHPSVLATWAPIEYALQQGYDHFDFMGAGRPDQDYGVREFKARFGGKEVCYGRYEKVVNKPLYHVGKLGLRLYQSINS